MLPRVQPMGLMTVILLPAPENPQKLLKEDTLKQLRPIGEGDQELEKRLNQKELT
jgi:hypothetical protein